MSELHQALLGPLLALIILLTARRWPRHVVEAPQWATVLYVLPFAIACLFTFPSLDDWCYGASGQRGWWDAQQTWYSGWSGRISATALLTGWGNCGEPWWAAEWGYRILLATIFLATCWALWNFFGALEPTANKREQILLTAMSATGWLCLLTDPGEGLYWLAGVASYGVGSLLILISSSAIVRGVNSLRWHWWTALMTIIGACLCSEVIAGLALSITAASIIFILRGSDRWRGVAILAGGLAATLVLLLAPGNAVRAAIVLQELQAPIDHTAMGLLNSTTALWGRFFIDTAWAPLAALGAWLAWRSPHHRPLQGALIALLIPAFAVAAALPMAWAGMSPGRAWNPVTTCSAIAVVVAAWRGGPHMAPWLLALAGISTVFGCAPGLDGRIVPLGAWVVVVASIWLLRQRLDRHLIAASIACAILLGSQRFTTALIDVAQGPNYVAQQQQRIQILATAAPGSDVVVPRLSGDLPYLYHIDDLHGSAKSWQNQGCASFFSLNSVRVQGPVTVTSHTTSLTTSLAPLQAESP